MDLQAHVADQDDLALLAGDVDRAVDDLARLGARGHHGRVHAPLAREVLEPPFEARLGGVEGEGRAALGRQAVAAFVEVDPHHHAAGGAGDHGGELPDQAEAVDRHHRAEGGLGPAHGVDRDPAYGHERGVAQRHLLRHRHHVVERGRDDLRVPGARVGDRLAHLEPRDALAERQHPPGAAVADLARHHHLLPDPPGGLAQPGREDGLLDHVAHPGIGQGLAGELDRGLLERPELGAGADQRVGVADEHLVGPRPGSGSSITRTLPLGSSTRRITCRTVTGSDRRRPCRRAVHPQLQAPHLLERELDELSVERDQVRDQPDQEGDETDREQGASQHEGLDVTAALPSQVVVAEPHDG